MSDRIVPGSPKPLTNADLLAALSDLLVAGTGITVAWNGTNEQWTVSSTVVGTTNLAIANRGTTTLDVTSDTGTDATIPAATTSLAGLLTSADKSKLDGIAAGATANSTDAFLLARANHTGTQAISTVTGLQTALDGKAALSHTHGNITNDGRIGSTANLPLITTTGGAVTVGSFGTSANTFCQGNDSRLSDARTPLAHNQAWSTITSTPTTLSGYGITDAQPLDSDLTAIAALSTTSHGRSLLTGADAAATRSTIAAAGLNVANTFTQNQVIQGTIETTLGCLLGTPPTGGGGTIRTTGNNNYPGLIFRAETPSRDAFRFINVGPWWVGTTENVAIEFQTNSATRFTIAGGGAATFAENVTANKLTFLGVYTVSTLPAAGSNPGAFAQVTDSNSTTNGNTVAGGGSNRVPVFSNGTNWIIK